jgi:hypothetical protein
MRISMKLAIESGVPFPRKPKRHEVTETNGYIDWATVPFHLMHIGDSIFFPGDELAATRARAASNRFSANNPAFRFTTKAIPSSGGFRIWRIMA